VASVSDDEALIAAAWLHDTVEETPATFEDLEREFGADVMQLVNELMDVGASRGAGARQRAVVCAGRLEKARQLQNERDRRGLPADLLDCLQFSDK